MSGDRRALFTLLLIPLLALGCVSGGGEKVEYSDKGVDFLHLESDITELFSGQEFSLRAQIQNLGESDAQNVKLKFFKYGDIGGISELSIASLTKPDPAAGLPGEKGEKTWRLSAPDITGRNEKVTQEIGIVVSYDYSTLAYLELPILPEESYLRYKQKGGIPSMKTDCSVGPVKINFDAPAAVLSEEETFTLDLDVEDVAGGYVTNSTGAVNTLSRISITFDNSEVDVLDSDRNGVPDDCDFTTKSDDGKTIYLDNRGLWSTGKTRLTCEFRILRPSSESYPTFTAKAEYTYNLEQTASIAVTGKRLYAEISSITFDCTDCDEKYGRFFAKADSGITATAQGTAFSKVNMTCEGNSLSSLIEATPANGGVLYSTALPTCSVTDEILYPIIELTSYGTEEVSGNLVIKSSDPKATIRRSTAELYIDTQPPEIDFTTSSRTTCDTPWTDSSAAARTDCFQITQSMYRETGSIDLEISDAGVGILTDAQITLAASNADLDPKYDSAAKKLTYDVSTLNTEGWYTIDINAADDFGHSLDERLEIQVDNTLYPKMSFDSISVARGGTTRFELWTESADGVKVGGQDVELVYIVDDTNTNLCILNEIYNISTGTVPETRNRVYPVTKGVIPTADYTTNPITITPITITLPQDSAEKLTLEFNSTPNEEDYVSSLSPGISLAECKINAAIGAESTQKTVHIGKAGLGGSCAQPDDCWANMCFDGICVDSSHCALGGELYWVGEYAKNCISGTNAQICSLQDPVPGTGLPVTYWKPKTCSIGCEDGACTDYSYDEVIHLGVMSYAEEGNAYTISGLKGADYKLSITGGDPTINGDANKYRYSAWIKADDSSTASGAYGTNTMLEGKDDYMILHGLDKLKLWYNDAFEDGNKTNNKGTVNLRLQYVEQDDKRDGEQTIHIHGRRAMQGAVDIEGDDQTIEQENGPFVGPDSSHTRYSRAVLKPDTTYRVTLGGSGVNKDADGSKKPDDGKTFGRVIVEFRTEGGNETRYTCRLSGKGSTMIVHNQESKDAHLFGFYLDTKLKDNYGSDTLLVEKIDKDESYGYIYSRHNVRKEDGTWIAGTNAAKPYPFLNKAKREELFGDTYYIELLPQFEVFYQLQNEEWGISSKAWLHHLVDSNNLKSSVILGKASGYVTSTSPVSTDYWYRGYYVDTDVAGNEGCIGIRLRPG